MKMKTEKNSFIPLKEITEFHHIGNIYEVTSAAIRRASQLTLVGSKTVEECKEHIVSAALTEVLDNRVQYKVNVEDDDSPS